MKKFAEIVKSRDWTRGRFSKYEFQVYGYRLAEELGDLRHKSLYIKLAKEMPRGMLEEALGFVKTSKAKSRARLFMWKVAQLRQSGFGQSATVTKPVTLVKKAQCLQSTVLR